MSEDASTLVTEILDTVDRSGEQPAEELLPLVYDELRRLAHSRMAKLPPGNTLQPTALVHEAYLRLVKSPTLGWKGRGHFFGAAARSMWQILVEQARHKRTLKRGACDPHVALDTAALRLWVRDGVPLTPDEVIALDEALEALGRGSREVQVVLLKYVGGLTTAEIATALDVSTRTVEREWRFARSFLYSQLADEPPGAGPTP